MQENDSLYFYQEADFATSIQYHFGNSPKIPDECPVCSTGIEPELHYSFQRKPYLQLVLRCPRDKCGDFFIVQYISENLIKIYPSKKVKKIPFDEEINTISEKFVEIYNEASEAEEAELFQICGVGYRKALEFLIKDYLISVNPNKANEIKRKLLGKCINEYVDDIRIKETARRASWIGNDETHYERIWESKDLIDLKRLIKITAHWISMEILTKKYSEEMQK
ncbi:hypothetical protein ACTWQB_14695 [Piscibacillus sp. B03]|uniref:hypothetical protein n=1 Tax=Piscibacillus sp. B03 TaxID=3457430 RepID=UPI003FCCA8C1